MATSFSQNVSEGDNDVSISFIDSCNKDMYSEMQKQTSLQNMIVRSEIKQNKDERFHCNNESNLCPLENNLNPYKIGNSKYNGKDCDDLPKNCIYTDERENSLVPTSLDNLVTCNEVEMSEKEPKTFSSELHYATKKMVAKYRDRKIGNCAKESMEGKFSRKLEDGDDNKQYFLTNAVNDGVKSDSSREKINVDESSNSLDSLGKPRLKKAKSASDFLQKLVQEQKSQVPTLFCRELPVLHSTSKVYSTDFKSSCAKISLFGVPNCSSDPKFVGSLNTQDSSVLVSAAKKPLICSEELNAKNSINVVNSKKPTAQYDSISSDEEERICKPKEVKLSPSEAATKTVAPESTSLNDCSGKLRFYLDGRFVLELTHSAGNKGNSKGWVQSRGKIWRPTSQVAGRLTRTPCKKTITDSLAPQVSHTSFLNFLNSSTSLFMLQANKHIRATCLIWLSKRELKHGARNPLVDLHELYQLALQRNQPALSPSSINFSKKPNKRKRLSLNGIWNLLQKYQSNCKNFPSSKGKNPNEQNEQKDDDGINSSLLLSALTKPKAKENKWLDTSPESAEIGARISSHLEVSLSPDNVIVHDDKSSNSQLIYAKGTNAMRRTKKDDAANVVPNVNKTESCNSSLLPLPEWYLDPSKAEVPISEMIGYPRPYFPPVSNENRMHVTKKKRHAECMMSKYPNSIMKKKLIKEDPYKENGLIKGEPNELLDMKTSDNCLMWIPKVEQNIESHTVSSHKHQLINEELKDSDIGGHQSPTNIYETNHKIRCAKRFGSYGRGHAVNEAIRTFVIGDIVNLGGDIESRYVPSGVYSEVASRYKIDVSVTTRWWLRYCADCEQFSKKNISSHVQKEMNMQLQLENFPKSDRCISTPESMEDVKTSSKTCAISEPRHENFVYRPRAVISKDGNCFTENRMLHEVEPNTFYLKENEVQDEEMPLDLRVKRSKIGPDNSEKLPYLSNTKSAYHPVHSSFPADISHDNERTTVHPSVSWHRNNVTGNQMSSKLSSSEVHNTSAAVDISKNWEGSSEHSETKSPKESHAASCKENSIVPVKENISKSGFDSVSPPASDQKDTNVLHSVARLSTSSEPSFTPVMDYPPQNSALKPLNSVSSQHCVSLLPNNQTHGDLLENEISKNSSPKIKTSVCSSDASTTKPVCVGVNSSSKSALPTCSSFGVPLSSLHGDYARLGPPPPPPPPPPIALSPWPYAPCPLVSYGPTLVNSYYYCCCFLPGCRFHYIYGADGQPIEADESLAATPPLLLANGYSKYCPPVADISPVIFDSIHQDHHVYKSWNNAVQDSRTETHSPVKLSLKADDEVPKDENTMSSNQNSESSGSMLKDLLLKPSRGTPERVGPSPKPSHPENPLNSRPNSADYEMQTKVNPQNSSSNSFQDEDTKQAVANHMICPTHSRYKKLDNGTVEDTEQLNCHETSISHTSECMDLHENLETNKHATASLKHNSENEVFSS